MIGKLEMFIALAQAQHFGRAAEALGVAQPTLSAALKSLEGQLGVELVRRDGRWGGLTPEGERVLVWARRIVADAQAMRADLRPAEARPLAGHLRLAAIPTALDPAGRLIAEFLAAHPGVTATLTSASTTAILAGLDGGMVDVGLGYLDNEPLGDRWTVPLHEERYALILRAGHALAGRASLGWAELGGVSLALLTPDMQNRRIVSALLAQAGIAVEPRVESNSTIVLLSQVRSGAMSTILPVAAVTAFLHDPDLAVVPLVAPDARHQVGLIVSPDDAGTPLIAALLGFARAIGESDRFADLRY